MRSFRPFLRAQRSFQQKSFSAQVNQQIRLASRPTGMTTRENWTIEKGEVVYPTQENEILVEVSSISLDPAMRGWLNDAKSYIRPVGIGEVMRANGVGTVVASNNPKYKVGDAVMGGFGVQKFSLLGGKDLRAAGVTQIDLSKGTPAQWLNVLGMPGMTAYFGFKEVGLPKAGETIVISAAAGAVGQTVGQLGKIYGLRVVGIAGGAEKCDWVVNNLGFDACIDYKKSSSSVREGLKEHCPEGVDIYFDNVGGDILDAVLGRINRRARIIVCGAISQYNSTTAIQGPKNYLSLLVNRARMEGMVVFDYADRYQVAVDELAEHLKSGKMVSKEHVETGIENFPEAMNILFDGKNFGKLILKV
jgi:NADPH-dependent curcumin reductase